jgi:hypothetical protein
MDGPAMFSCQWVSHCSTVHTCPGFTTAPDSRWRSSLRTFAVTGDDVWPLHEPRTAPGSRAALGLDHLRWLSERSNGANSD